MHDKVAYDLEELAESYTHDELLFLLDKADCEESFVDFIKLAWHVVEPGQDYVHNWHIDMIAAHLTAITDEVMIDDEKYYNRLLINVPPGAMKSLLTNVFWPAWEWGPRNMPHLRYVCASHGQELAIRDSTKMRRLIQSEWYQSFWGDRVTLTGDQNAKTKFENTATGFRQAVAAGGITGARGDRVIIDDPHTVESAASDQMRSTTIDWFLQAVPTRLNNPDKSAIVVIMQRLHEEDVSGVILDKGLGYDHIMLPMEYEPLRAAPTMLGWEDQRETLGELLFPERFPEHVVERDKRAMGPYAVSGQFQQTPTPADGGIIKRDWWQLWEHDLFPAFDYIIASLDTAYTEKTENDPSALTIWGVYTEDPISTEAMKKPLSLKDMFQKERGYKAPHPKVMLVNAWTERLELHQLVTKVAETLKKYKADAILIEDKAAGHSVAQELRRLYNHLGFMVITDNPNGIDKRSRLYSVQHIFAEGLVYAPDKSWADMVITQSAIFPKGKHDDLVDTVSMALRHLRKTGMIARPEEAQNDYESSIQHRGAPPAPLYAV
jgi:predicted phage terminase large subunit-like protein